MGSPRTTTPRICEQCACPLMRTSSQARLCRSCKDARSKSGGRAEAHAAVTLAISRGELPRADTFACVDCGKQARDWDHRDYSKPLDVVPVCRSCNKKRGPGLEVAATVAA